jgi:hypothetical protein
MRRRLHLRASIVAVMSASIANAQTAPEEVHVRDDRALGFASTVREGDTPREVTDTASLIEGLPGVHVRRLGSDDGFATLSIRGSTSSEVAVVFAGVPLTGGADPTLDLGSLPLWPGSRARVYRSFAPATLGPGSLGGTLALDPPRVGAPLGTDIWAAYGSYGEARVRIGDVSSVGGGRLVTALSASRADDDFSYFSSNASLAAGRDVYATRTNNGHAAINGLVAWSMPIRSDDAAAGVVTATTLAQDRRQELPGGATQPTRFAALESNRELAAVELALRGGPGVWVSRVWGKREETRLTDSPLEALYTLSPSYSSDAIVATGGAFGWHGPATDRISIDARIDGSAERFLPGVTVGAAQAPGAARSSVGGGVDAEWRATDEWTFGASGRLDVWRDTTADGPSDGKTRPTGHVGTEVALGPVTLAAHGGAVGRPASFVERYGDRGAFLGDPTLRPESAWTTDAGARFHESSGPLRLDAELVGFGSWADDLIVYVPTGAYGRSKATNIGTSRIVGAEAELRARLYAAELRASYTALSSENLSACAVAVGSCPRPPLPGRPSNDFVADLIYTVGPAHLRYGVDAVSGISASLGGDVIVPPRVLQSTGVRVDVPGVSGLRVALDVRNLFDVRIASYDGVLGAVRLPIGDLFEYPLPGRTFLVSVRYTPR